MRADLPLHFDGPGGLGDRFGGAGQGEEFGAVRACIGQAQDAVGGTVAGRGVIEVPAGGAEVEGKPAGEVAQPGNVAPELGLVLGGDRLELGGECLGGAETTLAHVKVRGPQARGQARRPVAVFPDTGEDAERGLGAPGYALAVASGHGQARGDGARPRQ